ncbi:MAG: PA0069 family radical SAM protein [Candidatus Eutrophobiaceae bacterium]
MTDSTAIKGRGAARNIQTRYQSEQRTSQTQGGSRLPSTSLKTTVQRESIRQILSKNDSPDIPFDYSINPYRGCEHGCIYCYARPSHAWLDLSPGLDFETRLFARVDGPQALHKALSAKSYRCTGPIALGSNTDPYQPIERDWRVTRGILEVLEEFSHPLTIVTKSWRVEEDMDLLIRMARRNLVRVFLSVATLDTHLARIMEPRAPAPARRIKTISHLRESGIPVGVIVAPMIPALNDNEMESILKTAVAAGARRAGYILLRLPLEVRPLFEEWLELHFPDRKEHVFSLLRQAHGGQPYSARFRERFRGTGAYAEMLAQRFRKASQDLRLEHRSQDLSMEHFRVPGFRQLPLFQE